MVFKIDGWDGMGWEMSVGVECESLMLPGLVGALFVRISSV